MFCRYRRTIAGETAPCTHVEDKPASLERRPVAPRLGPIAAQARRGTQGGLARHN
jgi:hypothetical protein